MSHFRVATAVAIVAAVVALPGIAEAKFSASATGGAGIGATTIRNGSGFGAACVSGTQGPVTLSWTASPDTFVSYVVTRSKNGLAATTIATLPASTVSYSDDSSAAVKNDVWTYTIRATVGTNWTTGTLTTSMSFPGGNGKC